MSMKTRMVAREQGCLSKDQKDDGKRMLMVNKKQLCFNCEDEDEYGMMWMMNHFLSWMCKPSILLGCTQSMVCSALLCFNVGGTFVSMYAHLLHRQPHDFSQFSRISRMFLEFPWYCNASRDHRNQPTQPWHRIIVGIPALEGQILLSMILWKLRSLKN